MTSFLDSHCNVKPKDTKGMAHTGPGSVKMFKSSIGPPLFKEAQLRLNIAFFAKYFTNF